MQVVSEGVARGDVTTGGGAWVWLSAIAVGMRTRWLLQRPRASGPNQRAAITSAHRERQPDSAGGAPQRSGPDAMPATGPRSDAAPDLATFDQFYSRHEQPLYGYLRRLLSSHEIAVEIAQETFFRAWRHFDALSAYERRRPGYNGVTWLNAPEALPAGADHTREVVTVLGDGAGWATIYCSVTPTTGMAPQTLLSIADVLCETDGHWQQLGGYTDIDRITTWASFSDGEVWATGTYQTYGPPTPIPRGVSTGAIIIHTVLLHYAAGVWSRYGG